MNLDVLLDDRDISPGNMFSDADLIGISKQNNNWQKIY